jgi:ankyrin repeat protein
VERRGDPGGGDSFFGGALRMNRLISSCMFGKLGMVRMLLRRGRDPGGEPWDLDEPSMFGNRALHWAAKKGFHLIVFELLKAGATVVRRLHDPAPPLWSRCV